MRIILSLLVLLSLSLVKADAAELAFDNSAQEAEYYKVINQLRCPKCENQTIADSDADIAKDLRFVVYQKIKAGESSQVIMRYMQKRYGDFVLYDPPVKPINYVLWFLPLLIFAVIFIVVIAKVGRRKPQNDQ